MYRKLLFIINYSFLVLVATFTILIGYLFLERLHLPYTEEGRYFDGTVVYQRQTVDVFAFLFFNGAILTSLLIWARTKLRTSQV